MECCGGKNQSDLLYEQQEIDPMVEMNVSLPERMKDWVEERLKDGCYATASDYVRELIRRDQEQRHALVGALIEGEESGTSTRTVRDIAAAARSKLANGG
jgi:antitoxin ParD1/3/4